MQYLQFYNTGCNLIVPWWFCCCDEVVWLCKNLADCWYAPMFQIWNIGAPCFRRVNDIPTTFVKTECYPPFYTSTGRKITYALIDSFAVQQS